MRDGWREFELGDLLRPGGETVSVSQLARVDYAGVRWYALGVYRRDSVDSSAVKAKELKRISPNQVVYNRMWATKAAFGVAGAEVDGCVVTNDFPVFDVGPQLLPAYLRFVFTMPEFQSRAAGLAVGTTERRRLLERDFLRIPVAFPSLAEQYRIVDLVSTVDRARCGRSVSKACELVAIGMITEVEREAAPWTRLSDVVKVARAGATPSRQEPGYWGGGIPWLKSGEADSDHIGSTTETISERGLTESSAWLMPAGTVVVAMYGQGLTAGSVGYIDAPMCANQAVLGLIPDDDLVHPRFLFHWLRGRKESMRARRSGSSQPNLNKDLVLQEPVPLLPLPRQVELASVLDDLSATSAAALGFDHALANTQRLLLADLLAGRHVIPGSYDRLLDGVA